MKTSRTKYIIFLSTLFFSNSNLYSSAPELKIEQNPFSYSSYYRDCESGLYYLKARYYSPKTNAFITRDNSSSANRYSYCTGNPISNTDASGQNPSDVVTAAFNAIAPHDIPGWGIFTGSMLLGYWGGPIAQIALNMAAQSVYSYTQNGNALQGLYQDAAMGGLFVTGEMAVLGITRLVKGCKSTRLTEASRTEARGDALGETSPLLPPDTPGLRRRGPSSYGAADDAAETKSGEVDWDSMIQELNSSKVPDHKGTPYVQIQRRLTYLDTVIKMLGRESGFGLSLDRTAMFPNRIRPILLDKLSSLSVYHGETLTNAYCYLNYPGTIMGKDVAGQLSSQKRRIDAMIRKLTEG